ncbi:ATP-binding protein [Spiroplasma gladiatoris]|uniref:ATP-binding protein n=1 Tax=Spiroplasma gladiatoris TaxID=2143 RepID=A0A4P7AI25_9MOLU|nr:ATP-binding protein [Spiroplasma gladiatoris]QBQ07811.1 ATP-binding protein [Spiroplasma gladiatoris]
MLENKNKIPRTNREFLGYIDKTTSHIYMISEFIDNSIQSALDYKKDHINVNVIINMKEECIYIVDNACGIPYESRNVAIKNGKSELEQGESLNKFGVGMKMAAIWFGKRLTIYTKHINDNFAYSIKLDVDQLEGEDFYFTDIKNIDMSKESGFKFEYNSGTIIKIDKLHTNSVHSGRYESRMYKKGSKENGKALEEQLACRYARFIRKGMLSINLSYINKKGQEEMGNDNRSVDITQAMIPNPYISPYDKNDYEYSNGKNINSTREYKEIFGKLKEQYFNKLNENVGFEGLTYGDIFETFENQKELKFSCFIVLNDDKYKKFKIPFTFGFIGKNDIFLKYNGLSVYQDNRAIIAGPNTTQTNLTWMKYDKALSGKSHYVNNRFIGEIDLNDKKIFRVDNNKMGFHGTVKEDIEYVIEKTFKNNLSEIFRNFLELIFHKDEQVRSDKEIKTEIERFSKILNKNNTLENIDIEPEELTMIEPGTDDERTITSFIIKDKKDSDNIYSLTYNINNSEFEDDKKIFKIDNKFLDNRQLLVLNINKDFYGFKKGVKDEALLVLINPIVNLILCSLSDCKNNEERIEKIHNIVDMFHNVK